MVYVSHPSRGWQLLFTSKMMTVYYPQSPNRPQEISDARSADDLDSLSLSQRDVQHWEFNPWWGTLWVRGLPFFFMLCLKSFHRENSERGRFGDHPNRDIDLFRPDINPQARFQRKHVRNVVSADSSSKEVLRASGPVLAAHRVWLLAPVHAPPFRQHMFVPRWISACLFFW